MMYNNGFPVTYQPIQQPVYMPQQPQPVQNAMIWIQGGEEGAKAYQTVAGSTIPLWDSEQKTIYLKTTDASGRPTMKILDYTIRGEEQAVSNPIESKSDYVTKGDLEELRDYFNRQINSIRSNFNNPNNSNYRGKENK